MKPTKKEKDLLKKIKKRFRAPSNNKKLNNKDELQVIHKLITNGFLFKDAFALAGVTTGEMLDKYPLTPKAEQALSWAFSYKNFKSNNLFFLILRDGFALLGAIFTLEKIIEIFF